jgi:hypothetical protein
MRVFVATIVFFVITLVSCSTENGDWKALAAALVDD